MNLALMYKDVGRHNDSMRVIEYARLLDPNDEYIRLGYSEALLRFGSGRKLGRFMTTLVRRKLEPRYLSASRAA